MPPVQPVNGNCQHIASVHSGAKSRVKPFLRISQLRHRRVYSGVTCNSLVRRKRESSAGPRDDACITPRKVTQFQCIDPANRSGTPIPSISITHAGPVPPLTVLFRGQPDYRNPCSQQAEFGTEREIAKGLPS